ncbi:succinylglutamate desuccinylase/aspartoacylase family protein [Verrucomicrobiales bacterium]|nr:succinylglutamate desuccinylase/aspartoacylase family protein [Verrucomicrobiales bacterium]
MNTPLEIGGTTIFPGNSATLELEVGYVITHRPVALTAHVFHGKKPGPRIFVSAGVHGDEINGIESVRLLSKLKSLKNICGTLILVPVVNIPAFLNRSRYLPDRRDLNRLFPGTACGPLGSRLAKTFFEEVIRGSDLGIDLHTGATNRPNLPQIRCTAGDDTALEFAKIFAAPVTIQGSPPDGSLRGEAFKVGVPVLTYEGGGASLLRSEAVRYATRGSVNLLRHLGALPAKKSKEKKRATVICTSSSWERAPAGGIHENRVRLGAAVSKDDRLGTVSDPFGPTSTPIISNNSGIVIGRSTECLVDEGDALFHIARTGDPVKAEERIQVQHEELASPTDPVAPPSAEHDLTYS